MTPHEKRRLVLTRLRGLLLLVFAGYLYYWWAQPGTLSGWLVSLFFAAYLASWLFLRRLPAGHYRGLLTGFVLDYKDTGLEADIQKSGIKTLATNTFMKSQNDRRRLAEDVLNFIQILRSAA